MGWHTVSQSWIWKHVHQQVIKLLKFQMCSIQHKMFEFDWTHGKEKHQHQLLLCLAFDLFWRNITNLKKEMCKIARSTIDNGDDDDDDDDDDH